MSKLFTSCLALIGAAILTGCGAGTTAIPAGTIPNITGNWQIQNQPSSGVITSIQSFTGALSSTGAAVTGTLRYLGSPLVAAAPCVSLTQDISVTGTIDATNLVTLTTQPFAGSVAVITLQLPLDSRNFTTAGSITITGGACAAPSTAAFGMLVPPLNGTYTGALAPLTGTGITTGTAGNITVNFTQGPANADGQFPLTANFSFVAPGCTESTTLIGLVKGIGYTAGLNPSASPFAIGPYLITGAIGPTTTQTSFTLDASLPLTAGAPSPCNPGIFHGVLTKQ